LLGAALGAGAGGMASLIAGGQLGKAISDAADGTKKLNDLSDAAKGAKKKVDEAHTAANDFKTLVDKYKLVSMVVKMIEAGTNPAVVQGLKDKLSEIQTKAGAIEAKLKDGGLNKTDKASLQAELDDFNAQEIMINAIMGATLDESQKTILTDRITELEKEEVNIKAKLDNPTSLSEDDKTALSAEKALIEAQLIGLKVAVGTFDTTAIDTDLAKLQADKEFLLNVKMGTNSLDEGTKAMVKKALEANEIATLSLQITASGLSEDEAKVYTDRIAAIKESLLGVSQGMLTQYALEHDSMDTTIGKLETILRLKEQEAQIADSKLMENVYAGREGYRVLKRSSGAEERI
jgi:hypothetical protein